MAYPNDVSERHPRPAQIIDEIRDGACAAWEILPKQVSEKLGDRGLAPANAGKVRSKTYIAAVIPGFL